MATSKFRPCIDLHDGKVKQIVGGTLTESGAAENFVSEKPPRYYAEKFREDDLQGGHVIKLGPNNDEAALEALSAWSGGLQIGGGINHENAAQWLEAGASHVIVTSYLFDKEGKFLLENLQRLQSEIGKDRLVIDLSCRRKNTEWVVTMNRWQTLTDLELSLSTLEELAEYCDEFLIHAADVEGLCAGMDEELVKMLSRFNKTPITYAGGIRSLNEIETIQNASNGQVDYTTGSALDIFGGSFLNYADLVELNKA